ncbi:substrate-binding domain-containing protein [Streptomyces europaeiscabiei]|uniref:LacI family DNA-binding transcriptional regulator n=1 Tax=Streptomyces europaeiscabiei TaxID=146819 RepID=UPI0029A756DD|nr:substrate-binding domain-containing protein [Streptomyces europaeiscabiei]MDX3691385.1 substrate-binding domain-containing protein [Streptomyces europaeiscabiei]
MARVTLESVARHASVSMQTVSNVINAPHRVRPETLARVQAAIEELNYRPNQASRTLRTRRSRLIGARIEPPRDGVNGAVLAHFLQSLTARTQEAGYRIVVFTATDDDHECSLYEQLLDDHDLDAFVLHATHAGDRRTAWLTERRVPFVTFGRPWGAAPDAPEPHGWVDVDGAQGTLAATRHLVEAGHRRIAFLGWPEGLEVGDDRRAGWSSLLAVSGIDVPAGYDRGVPDGLDTGREAAAAMLDLPTAPTAIVCASDSLALGAWTEITARGLRPGVDVAVVGFDDSPTAAVVGLSSVAQPYEEAAAACLRMLQELLTAPKKSLSLPAPVLLPPRLVVRASG